MIKCYENGAALVAENQDFLNTNPYLSMFFALDAPALPHCDKINYAVKAESGEHCLLAMKVEPYSMLLFGAEEEVPELLSFLLSNGYEIRNLLGSEDVCDRMTLEFASRYGIAYEEALAMDFMEASEITEPSCPAVEIPTEQDLDEIVECQHHFVIDCGLQDRVDREHTRSRLQEYRILRRDGVIACMASVGQATEQAMKIANVYTRPEYRGCGIARKVVNTCKNEILSRGMIATLNVDKKNPITNHLYESLGFRKVFSQGEYRRKTE